MTAEVLTLSAVTRSQFDPNARKTARFESEHAQEKTVRRADLLICRGNGNIGLVGRARRPTADMPDVAFPDTMIGASFDLNRVDLTFLEYLWDSDVVRGQVEQSARSTNGTHKINQGMVERIEIPLPSIGEQRRMRRYWTRPTRSSPSAAKPSASSTPSPKPSSSTCSATPSRTRSSGLPSERFAEVVGHPVGHHEGTQDRRVPLADVPYLAVGQRAGWLT